MSWNERFPGYYKTTFDFPITSRFFAVTPHYAGFDNFYVSAQPTLDNDYDLAVFVWSLDHASPADNGFWLVVY